MFDETELTRALRQDLGASPDQLSLSDLADNTFMARLAQALTERASLTIGGHQLTDEDYSQLLRNLVARATARFRDSVRANDDTFRRAVLAEAQANHTVLASVTAYLDNLRSQFGEMRAELTEISHAQQESLQLGRQISADVTGVSQDVAAVLSILHQGHDPAANERQRLIARLSALALRELERMRTAWREGDAQLPRQWVDRFLPPVVVRILFTRRV